MSFSAKRLEARCCKRLQNSFGLAEINARRFSRACIEEVAAMYGGDRIYIPMRIIDREAIRKSHQDGDSVEMLARRHGVTIRTVRRIIIR